MCAEALYMHANGMIIAFLITWKSYAKKVWNRDYFLTEWEFLGIFLANLIRPALFISE